MDPPYDPYQSTYQQSGHVTWHLSNPVYEEGGRHQLPDPFSPMVNNVFNQNPFLLPHPQPSAKMPVEVVQPLPQPAQILKSHDSTLPCPVCSRFGCTLQSHKFFSDVTKTPEAGKLSTDATEITPRFKAVNLSLTPTTNKPATPAVRYPVQMDAERVSLLKRWSNPIGLLKRGPERHLFPIKMIDVILPSAMKHAALFQALLAMSATLGSLADTGRIDETALNHQNLAAQILTQTCPDEISAMADECILSALLITLTYMMQARAAEADRHMSSVNHLVLMRGGPHYLCMSGIVTETLLYADYMHAAFYDRPVVWDMPLPALEIGPNLTLGLGFDKAMNSGELDVELVRAARSLCYLTEVFKVASEGRPANKDVNAVGYLSSISEYQLTRCNSVFTGTSGKNECVCLALLLFNHVILRDYGSISPFSRKLEYQLWTCLQSSDRISSWSTGNTELQIWVILTGLVAEIRGEAKWKVQAMERLRLLSKQFKLGTWNDIKNKVMNEFCWLPASQEDAIRSFWHEKVMAAG